MQYINQNKWIPETSQNVFKPELLFDQEKQLEMIVQYIVRDRRIIAYLQFFHPNNYEDVVETIEMNARDFLIDKRSTFEFVRYLTNFDLIKLSRLYDEELEKLETYLSFRFNGNFGNYTNDRVSSEQVELIRQYVIRKSTETFSFDEPTPASS